MFLPHQVFPHRVLSCRVFPRRDLPLQIVARRFFPRRVLVRRHRCSPAYLVGLTTPNIKRKVGNTTLENSLHYNYHSLRFFLAAQ